MKTKLVTVKIISRLALGLVWFYEGLVPKILFLRADELDLVKRSGVFWRTPEWTLQVLGIAQIALGIWLVVGWAERFAVATATTWMVVLIVLVVGGNPGMLTDPYGALVKDFCLIACAVTVWMLAPLTPKANGGVE
jgi:DoxX-like family